MEVENKAHTKKAIKVLGTKWPKAAAKIADDEEALLCYYYYPVEQWRRLRTTNPIEASFATVRASPGITKGLGGRGRGSDDLQALGGSRREVAQATKRLPAGAWGKCQAR